MNIQDILSKTNGQTISQEYRSRLSFVNLSSDIEGFADREIENFKKKICSNLEQISNGKPLYCQESEEISDQEKQELMEFLESLAKNQVKKFSKKITKLFDIEPQEKPQEKEVEVQIQVAPQETSTAFDNSSLFGY